MGWPYAVRRAAEFCPDVPPETIARRLNYASFVNLDRRYLYFETSQITGTSLKGLLRRVEGLPPIPRSVGPSREAPGDVVIDERDSLPIPSLLHLDDEAQAY